MFKKYLPLIIITSLLTLLPMLFGILAWNKLPDPMPTHFNYSGEADGYMSKAIAVFALPAAMLLVNVVCTAVTLMDPKRRNINGKPFVAVLWICPLASILVNGLMYIYAFGLKVNIITVVLLGMGILFVVLGNYLPKCGQNYSIGVKTPWALNDEDNWRATHRFGGKIFVAVGVLTIILAFFASLSPKLFFWVYITLVIVSGLAPTAYSYIYYIRHPKKDD